MECTDHKASNDLTRNLRGKAHQILYYLEQEILRSSD